MIMIMTVIMMLRVIIRGEDAGRRGVSDADIKEILEYHNRSEQSGSAGRQNVFTVVSLNKVAYADTVDYIGFYEVHFSIKSRMLVV